MLNVYAGHHGLPLEAMVLTFEFRRSFKEDCERCEEIDTVGDQIHMAVGVEGALSPEQKEKLYKIAVDPLVIYEWHCNRG